MLKSSLGCGWFRWILVLLALALPAAAFADVPITDAGLTILGMTDDFVGPLAQGDFNGDGVVDLAIAAPGT
jgi:hypothetical protein